MEFSPSPLFKQNSRTIKKLFFFVIFSFVLLIIDSHFSTLKVARCIIGTLLYPLKRIALIPRDMIVIATDFTANISLIRSENNQLRARNLALSIKANQAILFAAENVHLRALLGLHQYITTQSIPVEIQYESTNTFRQRIVIGQGLYKNIKKGAPVVNEDGVVGQVTRVFPLQSEVTLITDQNLAVPVQVLRTGLRSVIYGTPKGDSLDLRFVPASADLIVGDKLVTSGLDSIYPPGMPVATVARIDRIAGIVFARVICIPIALVRSTRQMLVLNY